MVGRVAPLREASLEDGLVFDDALTRLSKRNFSLKLLVAHAAKAEIIQPNREAWHDCRIALN